MFERFTDQAREVVVAAQEEARLHNHNYIGTEHLLLALLRREDTVAAAALNRVGVGLAQTRTDAVAIVGTGSASPRGHIPFTPRSKKVLELSLREALRRGDKHIDSGHILLGLLREGGGEGGGVAAQILAARTGDLSRIQLAVTEEMDRSSHGSTSTGTVAGPPRTPGAADVLDTARELAGAGPMGSHHLLEALARSPQSAAGRVLQALGVEPEALAAAIDGVELEGTTDLTPMAAAARRMRIELGADGEANVVFGDEATRELVRSLTELVGGPARGDDPAVGSLAGLWQALHDELALVVDRLQGPPQIDGDEEDGPLSPVRQAIQSRLRRRNR